MGPHVDLCDGGGGYTDASPSSGGNSADGTSQHGDSGGMDPNAVLGDTKLNPPTNSFELLIPIVAKETNLN